MTNRITGGSMATRLKAMIRFHSDWLPSVKVGIWTGKVFTVVPVRRLANSYSFQAKIQQSIATDIMPGNTSGSVTRKKARSGVKPSR